MVITREVNVLEMARGAILEQIDREAERIMANILDPNTDYKATRKLTITLSFKPNQNREIVKCEAQAKSSIAPIMPIETSIIVEADKDGRPRAAELMRQDPNQEVIFDEEPAVKVLKLRSV
jgi:hypothetical protein